MFKCNFLHQFYPKCVFQFLHNIITNITFARVNTFSQGFLRPHCHCNEHFRTLLQNKR